VVGPKGFTARIANVDLRPGGLFHYFLESPEGYEMWGKWVFREINPPERIVCISSFSDERGGTSRHPLHKQWPLEMLSTMTLTEQDGKTTVTVRWAAVSPTDMERETFETGFDSMEEGFTGTFDQLEAYLARAQA